ncbi:hypothetical protein [Nakamurella leprariae]|uniref:Uncharacterized protein n=1 Tax=Nakamurella leprariae TaxID=2803911 RepID=A0A938YE53_9ACTN|nr:hypothetical protein [Nakamurella leprariae]MBM9466098.1 hypothetical protein [Nakamurella leprariae]
MTSDDLMGRTNWSVQSWPDEWPTTKNGQALCAAVGVFPDQPAVVVYLNEASRECDLRHLPEAVDRFVQDYVDHGPDAGWDALPGGGHVTGVAPAPDAHPTRGQRMSPVELQAELLIARR